MNAITQKSISSVSNLISYENKTRIRPNCKIIIVEKRSCKIFKEILN